MVVRVQVRHRWQPIHTRQTRFDVVSPRGGQRPGVESHAAWTDQIGPTNPPPDPLPGRQINSAFNSLQTWGSICPSARSWAFRGRGYVGFRVRHRGRGMRQARERRASGHSRPSRDRGPRVIAALFVRRSSVYHVLGLDCWDEDRDARRFAGACPVIAHPPCRAWGRLRTFAKPQIGERDLARFALDTVRRCGGVLEHPSASLLWSESGIRPYVADKFGGRLIHVYQSWFGHRAPKSTGLYIVGVEPARWPPIPFHLGTAAGRVERMGRAERERTPERLAVWLRDLAQQVVA